MASRGTRSPIRRAVFFGCVVAMVLFQQPAVSGARRAQAPTDKEAMIARMVELDGRINALKARLAEHPENVDLEKKIEGLMGEYDAVSAALGGRGHSLPA